MNEILNPSARLASIDVKSFSYDKETGVFTWANCRRPHLNGNPLGTLDKDGYLTAKINQVRVRLHRLAWFVEYGEWPSSQIDHINGDKVDNRIVNLRLADNSENNCNRPVQSNNKLGIKGVRRHGSGYQALICKNKKQILLGTFKTVEEAKAAYDKAATKLHGDFQHG